MAERRFNKRLGGAPPPSNRRLRPKTIRLQQARHTRTRNPQSPGSAPSSGQPPLETEAIRSQYPIRLTANRFFSSSRTRISRIDNHSHFYSDSDRL
jgi:hypothetical protein